MSKVTAKKSAKSRGDVKQQLAECQAKIAEYQEGWQRAKADYANLQKRTAANNSEAIKFANASLILDLLPVVDNFESAYGTLPAELEKDDWVQGIGFIKQQLEKLLADNKVTAIKAVGEKFDPHFHEAVEQVKSDQSPGVIVEEVLRGYKLEDKVIRPARVKVAR